MPPQQSKSPRQTVSFLRRRFDEVGLHPNSKHGQNFLVDLNLVELLARSAEIGPSDVVLEIGTGTGSLTAIMAAQAAAVVTIELDEHLVQMATEELMGFDNVTLLHQDALRNKNNFHPIVLETLRQTLAAHPGCNLKLAANLPYNVATPVISNLLHIEPPPVSMTVTIQKELADRIAARPSTKDYGALSIWIQSQCEVELVRILPPAVFWPRPRVDSAIIHLRLDPQRRERIVDLDFFHSFVRAMFFHRRKFLRSELLSAFKKQLDKPQVDDVLSEQGLSGTCRAEELEVDAMLRLCHAVHARLATL